ncbi:TPA: hypothetical protein HI096_004991, partial [Escherichia coli]|nr:hypothetical protein [Escherichia coli]
MSKKFTKTILSAIMTGIFIGASASAVAQEFKYGVYSKNHDHDQKFISSDKFVFVYDDESKKAEIRFGSNPYNNNYANKTIIKNIQQDGTFDVVTADGSLTYRVYDKDVAALMRGVVAGGVTPDKKLNLYETDVYNLVNKVWAMEKAEANVGLDEYGNVAVTPNEIKERVSLQRYLAWESANSTIVANELEAQKGKLDAQKGELEAQKKNLGELTTRTDKIDAAAAATAAKVESRTLVGVSSDGTLTRAEGAKNTISVNDGLVALSGRTDRIDAAVGAIDGRVTRNTQSIEKNSKAIAANTRTLQQHSARLDSQQRQINENHKEMKRAAAQSAALTGLFQPYSVGKFNATAAVGGYSDQQALAVGVGYRFNEQTA